MAITDSSARTANFHPSTPIIDYLQWGYSNYNTFEIRSEVLYIVLIGKRDSSGHYFLCTSFIFLKGIDLRNLLREERRSVPENSCLAQIILSVY